MVSARAIVDCRSHPDRSIPKGTEIHHEGPSNSLVRVAAPTDYGGLLPNMPCLAACRDALWCHSWLAAIG